MDLNHIILFFKNLFIFKYKLSFTPQTEDNKDLEVSASKKENKMLAFRQEHTKCTILIILYLTMDLGHNLH